MSNDFMTALAEVAARVMELASGDEALRSRLRALARAVLAETEPAEQPTERAAERAAERAVEQAGSAAAAQSPAPPPPAYEKPASPPAVVPAAARMVGPSIVFEPRGQWDLREQRDDRWDRAETPAAPGGASSEVTDADLELIDKRLRLKAEGSRWAAARRRRIAEGADYRVEIEPLDRDLIDRAKKVDDCFLWMNHPSGPSPADLSLLDDLGGCYQAAADAVAVVRGILDDSPQDREALEQSLELMAEAQSALRVAVERTEGRPDNDQFKAYQWLRAACWRLKIFIPRHMRVEDPADPTSWADIDGRVEALGSRLAAVRQRSKQVQASLKRVRYHLKRILQHKAGGAPIGVGGNGTAGTGADLSHDWKTVMDTVDQMVRDGLPPSNAEVRELLLPVLDAVPATPEADVPAGFERVMREIDRYVASRPAPDAGATDNAAAAPTAEVAAAANLLRGKTMVLIGGARRREAHDALKAAFDLKELDWVETREHESVTVFEPHVARPDVALVVLAIRWSSHCFADVKQYCDRYGKPLVRLPAGYNPNQVAVHVLGQCSGKLGGG